jgi:hypothetical protein
MCRIMVIRSPCVGMTRPAGLPGGGSERAVQEAQAALGGHADPRG